MSKPQLLVVVASTRPGRIGIHFGRWFTELAEQRPEFDVRLVDLAEVNLPFFDEPKHPRMGNYVHQHTRDWAAVVAPSDALVFVTPEYNHGYNAVLKNALDFLHDEWRDKPVGFVSYGGVAAGTRAVHQLKQVVNALRMVPVVESVNLPFGMQFVGEDGSVAANEAMIAGAEGMVTELARLTALLRPVTVG